MSQRILIRRFESCSPANLQIQINNIDQIKRYIKTILIFGERVTASLTLSEKKVIDKMKVLKDLIEQNSSDSSVIKSFNRLLIYLMFESGNLMHWNKWHSIYEAIEGEWAENDNTAIFLQPELDVFWQFALLEGMKILVARIDSLYRKVCYQR